MEGVRALVLFALAALGVHRMLATLQTDPSFGRVLAAYGGVFVAGSPAWGVLVDGLRSGSAVVRFAR